MLAKPKPSAGSEISESAPNLYEFCIFINNMILINKFHYC